MKYLIRSVATAVAVGLFSMATNAAIAHSEEQVTINEGRYKIFIADHDGLYKGKMIKMKSIFKLDKETGIVWRYRQGLDSKGKQFEEFFEVPNQ